MIYFKIPLIAFSNFADHYFFKHLLLIHHRFKIFKSSKLVAKLSKNSNNINNNCLLFFYQLFFYEILKISRYKTKIKKEIMTNLSNPLFNIY